MSVILLVEQNNMFNDKNPNLMFFYIGQVQRNDHWHVPNDADVRKRKK